jgi:hypothetical protein
LNGSKVFPFLSQPSAAFRLGACVRALVMSNLFSKSINGACFRALVMCNLFSKLAAQSSLLLAAPLAPPPDPPHPPLPREFNTQLSVRSSRYSFSLQSFRGLLYIWVSAYLLSGAEVAIRFTLLTFGSFVCSGPKSPKMKI